MNWTRLVVRVSIVGAIVTAIAVFFAIGFRRLPPPGPGVEAEAVQAR